jgi:hypothetical protein
MWVVYSNNRMNRVGERAHPWCTSAVGRNDPGSFLEGSGAHSLFDVFINGLEHADEGLHRTADAEGVPPKPPDYLI